MEDDACVRYLAEFIYVKKFKVTAEMTAPNCPLSAYLLISDFSPKLRYILTTRHMIQSLIWCKHFDILTSTYDVNTHEDYVKSIIWACFYEHYCSLKVFDSFINVCSFVKYFCTEISEKKGKDFDYLNFDIFMEFYDRVLKRTFRGGGGFQRFVKYILQHEYLTWNLNISYLKKPSTALNPGILDKIGKLLAEEKKIRKSMQPKRDLLEKSFDYITQKVLSATTVKHPALPGKQDLNQIVSASTSNDEAQTAEEKETVESDLKFEHLKEVSPGCSNSNSKMDHDPKQKGDISEYENVIEAIIRHNHSKTSDLVTSDNNFLKEAGGILKHLKYTIESLIEVLDEYDKE